MRPDLHGILHVQASTTGPPLRLGCGCLTWALGVFLALVLAATR